MLKLSTKIRYATRILVYLAMQEQTTPSRKSDIASAEEISPDYVEQLLIRLKSAGLVVSRRGTNGGFFIARDPNSISVAEVIEAAEGPISLMHCFTEDCGRTSLCVTRPLWQEANDALVETFSSTTIGDLANKAINLRNSQSLSFTI